MKKLFVLTVVILLLGGCDDPGSNSITYPRIRGVWNVTLQPFAPPDTAYTVIVESAGGSGAAQVSISGPDAAGGATVIAGDTIGLGSCGVTITFGDTTGFYLAAGDSWIVNVSGGAPGDPLPGNSVASVVGPVTAGGSWTCATPYCDGSALASTVPFAPTLGQPAPDGGQWMSVRLNQNGPNVSGSIAEQHVLTLELGALTSPLLPPLVNTGDIVNLSYRRVLAADGNNGDYFRVLVTNGSEYLTAEFDEGADMTSGDTTVNLTFLALTSTVRVDFIGALSDPGESIVLDQVSVTSSGGGSFTDDFEALATACPPAIPAGRWTLRSPSWEVGSFCASAGSAPQGARALRWNGGSHRDLTGSIISGDNVDSILSLLGLGIGGTAGFNGLFAEVYEPSWTHYLTTFSIAQQGTNNLVGTFRGEARPPLCVEDGQLIASRQRSAETDVSSSYWVMRIEGEANNCDPALAAGNTIEFGDTLSTLTGDTIDVVQVGGFFTSFESLADDYANTYNLNGLVSGGVLTFTLDDTLGQATANAVGVIAGSTIRGGLTGTLVFDSGRVCEVVQGAAVTVELIPQ